MYTVHSEEYKGYEITIHPDEDPMHPRRDFDPLGHMVCFHKRYNLGEDHDYRSDDYNSWEELEAAIRKNEDVAVMLPLYLYDHSGITMRTTPFSCPWDSGQVGFIYLTKKEAQDDWKVKRLTRKAIAMMENALISSVKEYDDFLCGNVYGYEIKDAQGEFVDSCWGFIGDWDNEEYGPLMEARSCVDNLHEKKIA
jgi:hypothetical protein